MNYYVHLQSINFSKQEVWCYSCSMESCTWNIYGFKGIC